jgi:hypothetical protein
MPLFWALIAVSPAACGTAADSALLTDPVVGEAAVAARISNDLRFLREEEKLARDVYITLGEHWDLPIFMNIASSEQVHTDRVKTLLDAYGIPDPVADDRVGVFDDSRLASLYEELVTQGKTSLTDALVVGATVEDLDIKDIADMMERTEEADVLTVYAALMCGSRNHMRAFVAQLESRGVEYEAQYITQAELTEIITTSRERCGRQ